MAWKLDMNHSHVGFSARHLMISTVRGHFDKVTVESYIDDKEIDQVHDKGMLTEDDFLNSHLTVTIDAASINTGQADRDNHLRSPDFFDVAKYPTIVFKMTRGVKIDDTHGQLIGDLTIRDVTKPVTLNVEFLGQAKSPLGTVNAGFVGEAKISRKTWGLEWNVALETGGWMVSDEIKLDIEVEFIQAPDAAPAQKEKQTA